MKPVTILYGNFLLDISKEQMMKYLNPGVHTLRCFQKEYIKTTTKKSGDSARKRTLPSGMSGIIIGIMRLTGRNPMKVDNRSELYTAIEYKQKAH